MIPRYFSQENLTAKLVNSNIDPQAPLLVSFEFEKAQTLLGLLIVTYHKPDLSVKVMIMMMMLILNVVLMVLIVAYELNFQRVSLKTTNV